MKYIHIIWVALMAGYCWACSESSLTPSEPYHNFGADANATDEESVLRRNFFEANGLTTRLAKNISGRTMTGNPCTKPKL